MKQKKPSKPKLVSILVMEISTNSVICVLPPTRAGENRAKTFECLADVKVIRQYD